MKAEVSTTATDIENISFSDKASAIEEINRLYAEIQRLRDESQRSLDNALFAAWHAGKLLISEKARIRRHAGRGAWIPWLEACFHGGVRTAQRYMQLARRAQTLERLHGLSLRQTYLRLGIPIMSKTKADAPSSTLLPKLPPHVVLAVRLTRVLRREASSANHSIALSRQSPELIALYKQLRILFESSKPVYAHWS